jgi:hypothetical protein
MQGPPGNACRSVVPSRRRNNETGRVAPVPSGPFPAVPRNTTEESRQLHAFLAAEQGSTCRGNQPADLRNRVGVPITERDQTVDSADAATSAAWFADGGERASQGPADVIDDPLAGWRPMVDRRFPY